MRKNIKRAAVIAAAVIAAAVLAVFGTDCYVRNSAQRYIISALEAYSADADCILVLGAGVNSAAGVPSLMLRDRLDTGIELYKNGAAEKLIMSGDHGRVNYDEVNIMKQYAIDRGVPSEDVFMDHAGFSTYESMYRARDVFEVKKMIIVSQQYHLYRAVYNAKALGLEAYGVSTATDPGIYGVRAQQIRDMRETAARVKDFMYCIVKPKPTFLGEVIPVSGSGDLTNDKDFQ